MFLGYANFYQCFIKGFSGVVKPLTKLTGNEPWKWGEEQTKALNELKAQVCSEPVIAILIDNAPYQVEANASDYAAGARSLLSPTYSAPFQCGMPRSPSQSVRTGWCQFGRDTYVQSSDSVWSPSISFGLRAEWGQTSPN